MSNVIPFPRPRRRDVVQPPAMPPSLVERYGYEVLAEADASPSPLAMREYGYDAAALAGLAALHARCVASELTLRECAPDSFLPPKGAA